MDIATAKIAPADSAGGTETLVQPSEEIRHTSSYRPEIDGLRAVAVIPVVLFHAGLTSFAGGFVGVDVFFVISGYLITGLLYRECIEDNFSIARFYERRIRRIFPALFVMLFAVFLLGVALLVPAELVALGARMASTTLFVSNIYYWRHSGYFDEQSFDNSLLHTWSLSIEEQFYIIFPVALWLLIRWRVRLLPTLALVSIVSFVLSIYSLQEYPTATFFLLPTRAWELMIGGMLALVPTYRGRFAGLIAGAGIAAIMGAVLLYWESIPFPGAAALVPCLGAAAVIAVGGDNMVGRILASGPFRGVGLISYSLYLWHRPLFVFATLIVGHPLPAVPMVAAVFLSFVLAVASWYFVEQPVRRWRSRRRLWILGIFCLVAGIAMGGALIAGKGFPDRYSAQARILLANADRQKAEQRRAYGCGHDAFGRNVGPCPIGVLGQPQLVVIGDSHAMALRHVLNEIAIQTNTPAVLIAVQGCPPLLDFDRLQYDTPCAQRQARIFRYVQSVKPEAVLLIGSWRGMLFTKDSVFNGHVSRDERGRFANVTKALSETIDRYQQLGAKVGILLSTPGAREIVARNLARGVGAPLTYSEKEQRDRFAPFKNAVLAIRPAAVGDPTDVFCHNVCEVQKDGKPLYIDDNHVNQAGEKVVEPVLRQVILQLLK